MGRSRRRAILALASAMVAALPAAGHSAAEAETRPHVPERLLVAWRRGTPASERAREHADEHATVEDRVPDLDVDVVRLPAGADEDEAAGRYVAKGRVRYAGPDLLARPFADPAGTIPNDPKFDLQWGLNNTGQTIQGSVGTPDADIDAPQAWNRETGSSSVGVAVIDTGMQLGHPDLSPNIAATLGPFGSCPFSASECAHATHVGGIAGARGGNGVGVAGVNWNVALLDLQFDFTVSKGAQAITAAADYASAHAMHVVENASWGGDGSCPSAIADALNYAAGKGVLFVAAAGNTGGNIDSNPQWPATCPQPNVLAVAATDNTDKLASFSSFGKRSVALSAPGVDVVSTYPTNLSGSTGYAYLSGTSMASPMAAGTAALVWAAVPTLTYGQVRSILVSSVDKICDLVGKVSSGGRLNAGRAVQQATPSLPALVDPNTWSCDNETAAALSGSGWKIGSSARALGGTIAKSARAGDEANLLFSGTGVRWIGKRGPNAGLTDVYVDGSFLAEVDAYSASGKQRQVLFEQTGLAPGTHTLRLAVTGLKDPASSAAHTFVDGFQVLAGQVATRTEDSSSLVGYTGSWSAASFGQASGGTVRRSDSSGSRAAFSFTGTAVRWIGRTAPDAGITEVRIDGAPVGNVDAYAASVRFQQILFEVTGLPAGPHSIRVTVTGTKNASASDDTTYLDAFETL